MRIIRGFMPTRSRQKAKRSVAQRPIRSAVLVVISTMLIATTAAACSSNDQKTSGEGCTKLTFWTWVPKMSDAAAMYNKTHPGACVEVNNVGAGQPEIDKLVKTIKAGTGAPDLVQTGFSTLFQLQAMGGLVDLSAHGANAVKSHFPAAAWQAATINGKVYAIPQDNQPNSMMYNEELVKKYGLSIPKTWSDLLTEGKKLQEQAPDLFITGFDTNQPVGLPGQLTAAGAKPFTLNGKNLSIGFTSPDAMKYADQWDKLLASGVVMQIPSYTTQFWNTLDAGKIVMWPTPSWMPGLFSPLAKNTVGKWRIAPLPQWPGIQSNPNVGGSTTSVTTQSKHPDAATKFAMWLNTDETVWKSILAKPPSGLYPMDKLLVKKSWFLDQTIPLTGDQKLEQVFAAEPPNLLLQNQFAPFGTYASSAMGDMLKNVGEGKTTLVKGFADLQDQFTSYAKQQGFNVK